MSGNPGPSNWSIDLFSDCYNHIKIQQNVDPDTIQLLKEDLFNVLITPVKNEESRKKLADQNNPVKFSNGDEFKFNQPFIDSTFLLSNEFDTNEIATAEILYYSSGLRYQKGTDFSDSARYSFYSRYQYILNILGYLIASKNLNLIVSTDQYEKFLTNIIASFDKIYKLLALQNDIIDKQRITDNINDLLFINAVNYTKVQLFTCHEVLSQVLYALLENYHEQFSALSHYNKIMDHINKNIADEDVLSMHFLPVVLKFLTNMFESNNDSIVEALHKAITSKLSKDYQDKGVFNNDIVDLTKSELKGFEIVIWLMFFTYFTSWCKEEDARAAKFDFKNDVVKYVEWIINYDVMDKLLCYTAESANPATIEQFEWTNVYDFRSLLQKTFPRLLPVKFAYPSSAELLHLKETRQGFENVSILTDLTPFTISKEFNESLLAPFFHKFFLNFIANSAVILISLRDSEEDFLLSSLNRKQLEGEDHDTDDVDKRRKDDVDEDDRKAISKSDQDKGNLDLDEISTRAVLERFYLAFAYTYSNRPEISSLFWAADTSDIIGFFSWGLSNNTSPLITATFCLLLGSLASAGNESAIKIWDSLMSNNNNNVSMMKKNDYTRISIDSIVSSLNYYIDSLNENFEENLNEKLKQQQKRQEFLFSSHSTKSDNSNQSADDVVVIELAEDSVVFISGFVQLISSIFKNLSSDTPESRQTKLFAFNKFLPIINGFLYFDHLITSSKNLTVDVNANNSNNPKMVDLPNVKVSEGNRVVLTNLMLNLLSDISANEQNFSIRYKIWEIIDRWLYQGMTNEVESMTNSFSKDPFLPSTSSTPKYFIKRLIRLNQGFQIKLTSLSQVSNFIRLTSNLLTPLESEAHSFSKYTLLYPADLGLGYRINNQIGVWPYIEYLMVEVFGKSDRMANFEDQIKIKSQLIELIQLSINEIDWKFLNEFSTRFVKCDQFKLDDLVQSSTANFPLNYHTFIKLHHSISTINYLFDERCYKSLISIINLGQEAVDRNDNLVPLVEKSLKIVNKLLDIQETFIGSLFEVIKGNSTKNSGSETASNDKFQNYASISSTRSMADLIYTSPSIGTNGIVNFYEILLFHLSTIPNIALYVGNVSSKSIALTSISILSKVADSKVFNTSNSELILRKNRLLSTFQSIDESTKIKYAFIEQFQSVNDDLKYKILEFLLQNLQNSKNDGKEPNVSHFLLGYDIHGDNLILESSFDGANNDSQNTLLKVLLVALEANLDYIGDGLNIHVGPSKISSMILEILIKLSKDSISSIITLNYLRDYYSLFEKLLNYQPKIDLQTYWEHVAFNGDLDETASNDFIENSNSSEALFSFINQRNLVLQYLSLELHNIRSITKKDYYVKLLLNLNSEFLNGSPNVLNFLDVLNFKFKNFDTVLNDGEYLNSKLNLESILEEVKSSKFESNLDVLGKIVKVLCQIKGNSNDVSNATTSTNQATISGPANTTTQSEFSRSMTSLQNISKQNTQPLTLSNQTPVSKEVALKESNGIEEVILDSNKLYSFVTKYLLVSNMRDIQLKFLHSWCQLVEILITDPKISTKYFILEVLQVILPKINDYLQTDITFAEELISLSVLLFDLYDKEILESSEKEDFIQSIQRLNSLFETCITGILNSNSTPNLRSDLYVLTNKFLLKVLQNDLLVKETSSIIKSIDKKFIEIILNDSIYSEGSPRITSLLLLESLVHLASFSSKNYVLERLIKNNSLLLLVKGVKRSDEMVAAAAGTASDDVYKGIKSEISGAGYNGIDGSGISLDTLLFELTAFKATLYFLIRVAQSKLGALQLIQCEIFSILKQCSILKINPDLGLNLNLEDIQENIRISLVLDAPLGLNDLTTNSSGSTVSYFEFLIPIFQLVISIVLSMGPSYKPSITQSKDLIKNFDSLIVGIMKRDLLIENNQLTENYKQNSANLLGLNELVKLLTILDSLIHFEE